jgi:predicted short-subunit dehydrogenase-like oxidoreductase (DUF2520 family)
MTEKPEITIIGPGALGKSLIRAFEHSGYRIKSVVSRKMNEVPGTAFDHLKVIKFHEIKEELIGSLVFITIPDDEIGNYANSLSEIQADWTGKTVVHCSGFQVSEILSPLKKMGASIAAFHPIQTFIENSGENAFRGIRISIEGDSEAAGLLEKIAKSVGANPIQINQQQKRILHIAAVFMSNYVVALGVISNNLIKEFLPDEDFRLLAPLLKQTVHNLDSFSPADALSGPISRGDVKTIQSHLHELMKNDQVLILYKQLGQQLLNIADEKGNADADALSKLRALLH